MLVVTVVMGGITFFQQRHATTRERLARQKLLAHSLAPLVARIQAASTPDAMERAVLQAHAAHVRLGEREHRLRLTDGAGRLIALTHPRTSPKPEALSATVSVSAPALGRRAGRLSVSVPATSFRQDVRRRWHQWLLHMAITIGTVLVFLLIVIRRLVTRPLARLVEGVQRMELGYWGSLQIDRGAWELRWLGWRFDRLGRELQRTLRALLVAERRANEWGPREGVAIMAPDVSSTGSPPSHSPRPASRRLSLLLRQVEQASAADEQARRLAQELWDVAASEAERLGDEALKAKMEDAALRVLAPRELDALRAKCDARATADEAWLARWTERFCETFRQERLPLVRIEHRRKRPASIWRKMRARSIPFEQVADLVAFRLVVPTEDDCYWALGVVHRMAEPMIERFKDYVAAPKENGYQSLHTTVRASEGQLFEVQIRSVAMHRQAEHGDSAHWRYRADDAAAEVDPLVRRA